jgi:hypothetical protein
LVFLPKSTEIYSDCWSPCSYLVSH